MLIDDGNPSRGHRKNIFRENFAQVGLCNGNHTKLTEMTVLIFRGRANISDPIVDEDKASALQKTLADKEVAKEQEDQAQNDENTGNNV